MIILYHFILYALFLVILYISIKLSAKRRWRVIILTSLALYALSELNGYLKEKWFPTKPSIIASENGTRGFRISDQGKMETALLKPIIEIKSAKLTDSRNLPHFNSQNYPFLYKIYYKFGVFNGIENKNSLLLNRIIAIFDINGEKSKIKLSLKYDATINTETGQHYSTIGQPLFIGHSEEIKSGTLRIQCKFENYSDLTSQEFKLMIK